MSTELIEIYHAVEKRIPIVVATVITSRGSTPRTAGSKMIVYGEDRISGSIGGGPIEGDVIERALLVFGSKRGEITSYDLRKDGLSEDLDLICGGQMEVMLEYVDSCRENELLYGAVCQKIEKEEPFLWKAVIKDVDGGIELERDIQQVAGKAGTKNLTAALYKSVEGLVFVEPVLPRQAAYIVGAGHVSREIARLAKQVGMKTLIFDDRTSFANQSRFPEADGIFVCPEYTDIFEPFEITQNSYIIIVTRGHSYDKKVLGQALKTGAGYIGMMGSRKKRTTIFDALMAEGVDSGELDKVHCPIGLPINAETPAELAVSIVAELIEHRARRDFTG
ncbi:MAG: XdhC/CoxI family protein [Desulfobulbaceae bacterium]|nr:XdhC/CoxI family protein [Desulfofustis sp.]RZW25512.1 MAG: XdhC/CoxI family protein [Desulfobulbaceae bacterium]